MFWRRKPKGLTPDEYSWLEQVRAEIAEARAKEAVAVLPEDPKPAPSPSEPEVQYFFAGIAFVPPGQNQLEVQTVFVSRPVGTSRALAVIHATEKLSENIGAEVVVTSMEPITKEEFKVMVGFFKKRYPDRPGATQQRVPIQSTGDCPLSAPGFLARVRARRFDA